MGRRHFSIIFAGLVAGLALSQATPALAQEPTGRVPARDRVHPELVDSTWGRRVAAAWQTAFSGRDDDARAAFEALHREQPDAVEPMIGLGFVARAEGRRSTAQTWFRSALSADPTSTSARDQLAAIDWDRPTSLEVVAGTARVSGKQIGDWSAGFSGPVAHRLSLVASAGQIGGSDPLRGIFLDSASGGGVTASFVTGGLIMHPVDRLTISTRATRWMAQGETHDYAWFDGALRVSPRMTAKLGVRPLAGLGAPQLTAGADVDVAARQVATLELVQGVRGGPFEARSAVRAFYNVETSTRQAFRAAFVREVDPRNSATTLAGSATRYLQPSWGFRLELSSRTGAFARSSADVGLIYRP